VLLLAVGLVITLGVAIYLSIAGRYNYDSTPFVWQAALFQFGLFVVLVAILIYFIIKNMLVLRDPGRLNKLQIAETDERNLFIKQKTGSFGMDIVIFGQAIATLAVGVQNPPVFFALFASLLFVVAVRVFLAWYYRRMY